MKRFSLILFLLATAPFFLSAAYAQKGTVTGKVIDEQTNEALVGATVILQKAGATGEKARQIGAIARSNGEFQIRGVEPGAYKLVVNFISYKKFEKKIDVVGGETLNIDVGLYQDVVGLDEVVVTGVASRNEKAIADVSVSRVDAEGLQEANVYQDVSQLMTGKVSGVYVEPSSGNVGGGIRFNVRGGGGLNGAGQPVIYVDGARIANLEIGFDINGQFASTLADLNPEDIKSIEVLKGPAGAALYGTSGSNGVVLITTKRGRASEDFFSVNYKSVVGWNEQAVEYHGIDPDTAGNYDYTQSIEAGDLLSYNDANAIFREGEIWENNLSFTGKSGIFNYYVSYTNRDEQGIVIQNDYDRESFRANFEVFPSKEFRVRVSANYVWSHNARPTNDNNVIGWLGNTTLFSQSYRFTDSIAIANLKNTIDNRRLIGSFELNYMPEWLPGLSFQLVGGYDGYDYRNDMYYSPDYWYTGPGDIGEKDVRVSHRRQLNWDFNASYEYDIMEELSATSIIGSQMTSIYSDFARVDVQDFASSKIRNLNAGAEILYADDGLTDFRDAGIYFQQDFNYQDAYFVNLAVRQDYASVLGEDPPTIFYPKASAAVRLDRLGIDLDGMLTLLKVRGGWGQSGTLPGQLDAYPIRWAGGQSGFGVGALINSLGNPSIEPERINEVEFGLEAEFFNKYGFDLTYYTQSGAESIIAFPNPPSSGLTQTDIPKNVGEIETWGFESLVYAVPLRTRDYELRFDFIWNYQQNEIISLGGAQPIVTDVQGWYEGQPRSAFMVQKVIGANFDADGNYAGSKVSDSIEYVGTPVPVHTGSFGTTFRFLEHFSLYFMFDWALGHKTYNMTREFQINFGNDAEYNAVSSRLAELTPNTDEYVAVAEELAYLDPNREYNFIEESDWLRLREISFRVNATDWIHMLVGDDVIKKLNLVASVRNLALFTGYSGPDPTVNWAGTRTRLTRGVDFLTLQNARTFNFTFDIGL